ncbi:MAG: hypothetical protein K6E95_03115, partial [Lachnospiraceae bacterium]|nr:hypothetical protein [Lachnospiraceae bacterium]
MKKRGMGLFIAMGGIALVLIIASIILIAGGGYSARLVLVNDGFFVGETLRDSLYANDENAVMTSIPAINASQSDILYEKSGKLFVGDSYTPISPNYPYVINNASALMFTGDVDKLITGTFEYVDSYENLYMSGGVTFNADMERAYREDFILVDTGNGLYMNADKLTVGGALTQAGEIPVNSFIRFMEDRIDYYYYENDSLVYGSISPVSKTATVSLGGFEYTYIEFLEKLGLYSERKVREKVSPTPTPAPVEGEPEDEAEERKVYNFTDPSSESGDEIGEETDEGSEDTSSEKGRPSEGSAPPITEADGGERDDDGEREQITPDPQDRPTRAPRPTREPAPPAPAGDPLPAEDTGIRITPTPRPTATPLPTATPMPVAVQTSGGGGDPAVPAAPEAAASAEPVAANPPSERAPRHYTDTKERPLYYKEWKKPEVYLGDVTTGTFTIFLDNFNIMNSEFLYKRYGVQIYVNEGRDENGKAVLTKSVTAGGPLRLSQTFKPDTDYTIKVVLNYINAYGTVMNEVVTDFGDIVVTTKGRDFLNKLDLTYDKGKKATNSVIMDNVSIGIAVNNTAGRYIESVENISRVEIVTDNVKDATESRTIVFSSSDLSKLRKGEVFNYESSKVFRANSEYNYSIHVYDKIGERLLFADGTDEIKGVFKTCTESPRATFRVQSNKIYDYSVALHLANSGNAEIKNIRYELFDAEGNTVETTIKYLITTSGGSKEYSEPEKSNVHYVPTELTVGKIYDENPGPNVVDPNRHAEVVTSFTDLSDQTVYVLRVYADYDIRQYDAEDFEGGVIPDDLRWTCDEIIGETRFTTANISSLGSLFIDNEIPTTEENLAEGQLYMRMRFADRTNELLLKLLDSVTLQLYKSEKNEKGDETGRYVLDEDARISYVVCDADDETNFTNIASVVAGTRPEGYDEWEQAAIQLGQLAYDRELEGYYTTAFSDAMNAYTNASGETYMELSAKAENAVAQIESGMYAADSEEYQAFSKILEEFEEAKNSVEADAMNRTILRAENEKNEAYKKKMSEAPFAGDNKGFVNGEITFGSVAGGDEEGVIDQLITLSEPNDTASGSAISYKFNKEIRIAVTGLTTNTSYEIRAFAKATVGTSGMERDVSTVLSRKTFKTFRKRPYVKLDAYYSASDFITLFGVSIVDPDDSITSYPVKLSVLSPTSVLMDERTFEGPETTFDELRINNLARETEYSLRFIAKGFNRGWTNASAEFNKEIFVNDNSETLKIVTHESIKADISLISINDAYDLVPELRITLNNATKTSGPITARCVNNSSQNVTSKSSINNKYSTTFAEIKRDDEGTATYGNVTRYYISGTNAAKTVFTIDYDFGDEYYNIIEPGIWPYYDRYTLFEVFEDFECTKPISDRNDPAALVAVDSSPDRRNSYNRCYWTSNYIRLTKYVTGKTKLYVRATATKFDQVTNSTEKGIYPVFGFSFHKFGDKAYTANINAVLRDEFGQLGSGGVSTYYVRVYEKEGTMVAGDSGYHLISERVHEWRELAKDEDREKEEHNCLLSMYEYDKYAEGGRGIPLGSKTFVGGANKIDTNFGVRVSNNKYYRLELWVKINNYSVRVGTTTFTSDRIIHSINNEDDLFDAFCHSDESYIVSSDLIVARANIFATKQFDGVIDFNGHTLTHWSNDYLIYQFGAYGEIRNLVYEKGDESHGNYKNIRGIIYANYGTLKNITVNYRNRIEALWETNEDGSWKLDVNGNKIPTDRNSSDFRESAWIRGLLAETNYPTGVVENFCINLMEDIHTYAGDGTGLAVYSNYGMVRNGYSCSTTGSKIHMVSELDEFKIIYNNNETNAKTYYNSSYYTGGIVRRNIGGVVESLYGLVDMELRANDTSSIYKKGAAIVGLNEGYVRNCFSAAKVLTYNPDEKIYEVQVGRSPANLNFIEGNNVYGHSSNIYHYGCGYDYGICRDYKNLAYDSVNIRKELLYDIGWYEELFERNGITKPGQWEYEFVSRG